MKYKKIKAITEKQTPTFFKRSDTGVALFTEYGARLLGLFPIEEEDNVLWTTSFLEECLKSKNPFIGGERLWIAPERTFFYENPRDFEGHHVPFEIDPGSYKCISDSETVRFENRFSLLDYSNNTVYDSSIARRQFTMIKDPFSSNLSFIGFDITETLIVQDQDLSLAAWSITQVFSHGSSSPATVLFPAKHHSKPIHYFNPVPSDLFGVKSSYVRFDIANTLNLKLALRPEDTRLDNSCKIIYISSCETDDRLWFCVIKTSTDTPVSMEECLEFAPADPEGPRGAIYAHDAGPISETGSRTGYGEIGLQFKKGINSGSDTVLCNSKHQLLGYCGSKEEIIGLVTTLLGVDSIAL